MSALDGLMRVHRWILDERRLKLSDLEGLAAKLRGDLAALDLHLARQSTHDSRPHTPDGARRDKLLATVAELDREIEEARQALKETYEELESVELAQRNRAVTKRRRQSRRDAVAADERDVSLYRRRSAGGKA